MSYQVHITSTAEHDIMRAADYIDLPSFKESVFAGSFFSAYPYKKLHPL